MDTPGENPDGYKTTSVLTYAAKYKGLLRIIHGSSDDNVHMQNSVQFINLLQNMGKHFEFMLYPGERHGIGGVDPAKSIHNRSQSVTEAFAIPCVKTSDPYVSAMQVM